MRIKKIDIFNYRSCIKTRVEALTDLTTLIGPNGVGKSNILNSIQLLKKVNKNRYFHQPSIFDSLAHSRLDIIFEIDKENYNLKADIYYDTNEQNAEEIYSAELKIKNISIPNSKWQEIDADLYEFVEYLNRSNQKLEIAKIRFKKNLSLDENKLAIQIISYLINISYYSATQFSDPSKCPISLELEDSRLVRSYRKTKTHEQFIFDLYRTYKHEPSNFKKYINTVNEKGIGLIQDVIFFDHNIPTSSLKVKAGGLVEKIEKIKNIVVPSVVIDNLNLSPNQLSEGTFKTLALIFYILNDESDLLLIEEPEVCVHHGLLNSVIELIKSESSRKQIFISTHSDYVLDKLDPENVVLVRKEIGKGTIASSLPKSLSKNDFRALKSYLEEAGNLGEYWKEGGFEND